MPGNSIEWIGAKASRGKQQCKSVLICWTRITVGKRGPRESDVVLYEEVAATAGSEGIDIGLRDSSCIG